MQLEGMGDAVSQAAEAYNNKEVTEWGLCCMNDFPFRIARG